MEKRIDGFYIQDQRVDLIAEQYGLPLYVYDAAKMVNQVQAIRSAFENRLNVKIRFACKALTNISILKVLRANGVGLDTVSLQELEIGLMAGFKPSEISFTPSGVSWDEIDYAIQMGILVTLDSLNVLEKFGRMYGESIPCMIRVRPNVNGEFESDNLNTGGPNSKFGIDFEQREMLLHIVDKYNIKVVGLHQHTGSGIKDTDSVKAAAQILFDLAVNFPELQIIDLGGGFKVAYSPDEKPIDLLKFGSEISEMFQHFRDQSGKELQLWLEPGKYLVAEAGSFLVRVNAVKKNSNQTFVCVDSGLNHLIRPMFYRAHHEITNISNHDQEASERYDVVGYICETDNLATDRPLSPVSESDILAIHNAGAYGFAMSSQYCSRLRPAEVIVVDNKSFLIRRRETLDDLLCNQIVLDETITGNNYLNSNVNVL